MSPYDKAFIDPIRRQCHGSWFRTLAVPWGGDRIYIAKANPLKCRQLGGASFLACRSNRMQANRRSADSMALLGGH